MEIHNKGRNEKEVGEKRGDGRGEGGEGEGEGKMKEGKARGG